MAASRKEEISRSKQKQGNRAKHTIVRKSVYQQSIVCLHGSLKPIRIEQSMITNDLSDGLVMHVEGGCA